MAAMKLGATRCYTRWMSDSPKPAPGLWQTYGQVFASRRIAAMLLLGFSSGLPLALTAGALQAWLTVNGIDLHTIGYFALVGLPYTFKFVWAPLLDRFEPRLLGRRRGWILVFQLAMALACLGLAQLDPAHHIHLIAVLSVVVAWLSASQDVVFDAYRADLLSPEERGAGAAVSVLGYRLAMLVSGGGSFILADTWLGWPGTYCIMGVMLLLLMGATVWSPRIARPQQAGGGAGAELKGFVAMVLGGALLWWLCTQASRPVLTWLQAGPLGQLLAETAVMLSLPGRMRWPSCCSSCCTSWGMPLPPACPPASCCAAWASAKPRSAPSTRGWVFWPPSSARCWGGPGCRRARSTSR